MWNIVIFETCSRSLELAPIAPLTVLRRHARTVFEHACHSMCELETAQHE